MPANETVVVVGGGIWGLSTAYHLAQSGRKSVRVLERNGELADETTSRAAGLVGQIRSSGVMTRAIKYALELLVAFGEKTGHDPGLKQNGSLLLALTPERMAAYEQQVTLARKNGVEAKFLSSQEMRGLSPALNTAEVLGGFFVPRDGHLDPRQLALAYAAAAKDLGATIQLDTAVRGLHVDQGKVLGVETNKGAIAADHVVITTGPWVGQFAKMAGYDLAMQPIRHQRVRTIPVDGIPDHHPVVRVTDVSCYLRPEEGGYAYGFFEPAPVSIDLATKPADYSTSDIEPPVEVMLEARRRLTPVYPMLAELEVAERKQGMTTFAPDGAYLIGPVPGVAGLYLASGCAALGIAGSAAVGKWLARWILEGNPGEDLSRFELGRFGARGADPAWVKEKSERFYAGYYNIWPMIET